MRMGKLLFVWRKNQYHGALFTQHRKQVEAHQAPKKSSCALAQFVDKSKYVHSHDIYQSMIIIVGGWIKFIFELSVLLSIV